MDILERLEASPLGAAARRLTFGERPATESPDDSGLLPTVPAPAEDAGDNERGVEPSSPELADIRRDLDSVTAQLTQMANLGNLMQGIFDGQATLQQQINDMMTDRRQDRPTDRPTTERPDRPE
jgi:hypothetical protein